MSAYRFPGLPIDEIVATPPVPAGSRDAPSAPSRGHRLGASRQGRDVVGYRIGSGSRSVSLIAGCHADEPVGPAMLDRLAAWLLAQPASSPLLCELTWFLVPHVNPDGEARNRRWTRDVFAEDGAASGTVEGSDPGVVARSATAPGKERLGQGSQAARIGFLGADPGRYLEHAVREPPGDDVEFGFPHDAVDAGARPENRAVADFLRSGAPFALHASFHGMSFAAGPWFLIEAAWIDRTAALRRCLQRRVRELGYRLHDVDRRGEKGFHRIDEGFTTRPDSRAMAAHFEALGDPATGALFRPSSMEFVRSLGGDPLTLVSEMPLFLVPQEHYRGGDVVRPTVVRELAAELDPDRIRARAAERGVVAMPIRDQMRLQLEFLQVGLEAALVSDPR